MHINKQGQGMHLNKQVQGKHLNNNSNSGLVKSQQI